MYLGRIVAAGITPGGKPLAAYRVSSRSFPNRSAKVINGKIAVLPRQGHEDDLAKNPYIAYNCVRLSGAVALATNGSQTDPIIEKIIMGLPLRDAFALPLLAMDYEKDHLDTPRIAAAVDAASGKCMFGIVRKDAVLVREMTAKPGQIFFLSTYEDNYPCETFTDTDFRAETAEEACLHMISGGVFAGFEHPVTAAAAVWNGTAYDLAARDA